MSGPIELLRPRARPPDRQRLGHLRRDRRPPRLRRRAARALPVQRLRLEDDHAAAARRQPAAAAVRDAGRDDQLDRPAEQGPRRLPRARPARARAAAGARSSRTSWARPPTRSPRSSRRSTPAPEIDAIELNVSCPNVKTGLDIGADPRRARGGRRPRPAADGQAADREAHAERLRRARRRGGRGGRRRRRRLAHQHPARLRAAPAAGRPARPGSAAAPAACPAPRCARSRSRRSARSPARVAIPIVGMGGVQTGRHAARPARRGRHCGCRRDRELPRPGGGNTDPTRATRFVRKEREHRATPRANV